MNKKTQPKIIKAWEALSEHYQRETEISTYDVHYGPLAHGEKKLHLIDAVRRKSVLEIGCGGGQNTIALARWGGEAFGVDPSQNQILYARSLARACGVKAAFAVAPAEELPFVRNCFDVILSSHAFGYVADIEKAFNEVHRVLRGNGIFVLCLGHPYFRAVGFHLAGDPEEPEIRNYLSWPEVDSWTWNCGEEKIPMWDYNRTLSQIVNPLLERGFILERMIEQGIEDVAAMSEKEKATIPYLCKWDEKEYAIQRKLPCTLILKVRKPVSTSCSFAS